MFRPSKKFRSMGKESSQIGGDQFARRFVLFSSLLMSPKGVHVSHGPCSDSWRLWLSIKHATAMSCILSTELFQARRDTALATSKLLLENSYYELRNSPINANSLFDNKIREKKW